MKTLKAILLLSVFALATVTAFAQESSDSTKIADSDTTKITWGNKKILIIGNDDKDTLVIQKKKTKRYNHFAGIDLGINGLLNPDMGMNLQTDAEFMDLNYGKSINVGFNFFEKFMPIAKEKFGVTVGMGINYSNFDLDRDITIVNVNDSTFGIYDTTKSIHKNKFKTTFINVPLMFETNLGKSASKSFHLAVGGQIGYRLGSKTKQKFSRNDKKSKVKNRGDYNLEAFQFSLVARVGYGDFTLFAQYNLTPLFENNKGPELYPFTVGMSLLTF